MIDETNALCDNCCSAHLARHSCPAGWSICLAFTCPEFGQISPSTAMRLGLCAAAAVSAVFTGATRLVLTPELMIEAPRPGTLTANDAGTDALVGVQWPSVKTGETEHRIYHLSLERTRPPGDGLPVLAYGAKEYVFVSNETIAFVVNQTLWKQTLHAFAPERLMDLPAPISNVQAVHVNETLTTLVFSATAYNDSDLYAVPTHDASVETQEWNRVKGVSTYCPSDAVYDQVMVRQWDTWIDARRRAQLFAVDIQYTTDWKAGPIRPLMRDSPLETPVGPLGSGADFTASRNWVAFTAKAPEVPSAWHTKQNIYVVPLAGGAPRQISVDGRGWAGAPVISPDESTVAFLQQNDDGYESSRRVIQTYSFASGMQYEQLGDWQQSPEALAYSRDGTRLYIRVSEDEQRKIYVAMVDGTTVHTKASLLGHGSNTAPIELPDGRLLYMRASLHSPNDAYVFANGTSTQLTNFFRSEPPLRDVDLGPEPEQFTYTGSDNVTMHGWIFRPPSYEEDVSLGHKLPLAVLLHGGPEGDWANDWSVRWNPAVFAAAGFMVVTLDPSGSTGFGQAMVDRVLEHWGDRPFEDIIRGVHHVLDNEAHVDRERVVAAGASFGGYLINWIQGHNDDGLFKALVTHDGVFDAEHTWFATDELYFAESEFGGLPWEKSSSYARFSPHTHADRWNTPHLIVHGGKDYRLDLSEGIAAFNTLQRRRVPSRFVYFPEENHWVLDPRNSLRWHHEVLGWLTRWTHNTDTQLVFQ